jgi:predicted ferric reductase
MMRVRKDGALPGAGFRPQFRGQSVGGLLLPPIAALAAGPRLSLVNGRLSMLAVRSITEYYVGVLSLVALSLTVMAGVAATDRSLLLIRHRVLLQAAHRWTAVLAVGFLAVHVVLKVGERHAGALDVIVPFQAAHRPWYVGLGTIAGYLMVIVTGTGLVRGRFATMARPWLWRAVHGGAYIAWPVAIVHGLRSGRPAASWVTISYELCLIGVGIAVLGRSGRALLRSGTNR